MDLIFKRQDKLEEGQWRSEARKADDRRSAIMMLDDYSNRHAFEDWAGAKLGARLVAFHTR